MTAKKPFDIDEFLSRPDPEPAKKPFSVDQFLGRPEAAQENLTDEPAAAQRARELAAGRVKAGVVSPQRTPPYALSPAEEAVEAATFGAGNAATFGMANRGLGLMDLAFGTAPTYSAGVDRAVAREAALRKAHPIAHIGGSLLGGVGSGVGLARSGVTLARPGMGLAQSIGAGVGEGALYGAAQGAGQTYSEDLPDYVKGALHGAKWGTVGGAAGGALGYGARAFSDWRAGDPTALVNAARADEQGLRNLPRYGSAAMLPDAGPSMQSVAQGAVQGSGTNRTAIVDALAARTAGRQPRLNQGLEQNLGPAPRVDRAAAEIHAERQRINTLYDPVVRGQNVPPENASQVIGTIRALAHDRRANLNGILDHLVVPGANTPELSARSWWNARQAVDRMIKYSEGPFGDPQNIAPNALLTQVRNLIDRELATAAPGVKDVDALFAGNQTSLRELERGGGILDTARQGYVHPGTLAEDMAANAAPLGARVGPTVEAARALRQGARAETQRLVDTKGNAIHALEEDFNVPANIEKTNTIFGEPRAQATRDLIASERRFADTENRVVHGSDTAQRLAARQDNAFVPTAPPGTTSLYGRAEQLGLAALNKMRGASYMRERDAIARILAERDPTQVAAHRRRLLEQVDRTRPQSIMFAPGATGGAAAVTAPRRIYMDMRDRERR